MHGTDLFQLGYLLTVADLRKGEEMRTEQREVRKYSVM